jgi:hypothetical protein
VPFFFFVGGKNRTTKFNAGLMCRLSWPPATIRSNPRGAQGSLANYPPVWTQKRLSPGRLPSDENRSSTAECQCIPPHKLKGRLKMVHACQAPQASGGARSGTRSGHIVGLLRCTVSRGMLVVPEAWRYDAIPFSAVRSFGTTGLFSRKRLSIKSGLIMPPLRLGPHERLFNGIMARTAQRLHPTSAPWGDRVRQWASAQGGNCGNRKPGISTAGPAVFPLVLVRSV